MNRLTVRVTLALALLGGLPFAGDAVARTTVPQQQRMAGGASMNAQAIQDVRPTLDLLITVRLLSELLEQRQITLDAGARQELGGLLHPLATFKALRPTETAALDRAVRAALTPSQAQVLRQARAALQARAQAFMARARFATPNGPLNLTLIRYGLMVPGGQDTVNLLLGAKFNPYAQAGVNAAFLAHLLAMLEA